MVSLISSFHHLRPVRVLVVGDFFLDIYVTGKVNRISPEAPVPVLLAERQYFLPGGAGNVVLNLKSLGAEVKPFGRVGSDTYGRRLQQIFLQENIDTEGIVIEEGFSTHVKHRFLADAQQLLRVDFEKTDSMDVELERELLTSMEKEIASSDIIAVSDYGKGVVSRSLLAYVFSRAKEHGVPVIVDPKGTDFQKYAGASILKPNENEAYTAVHCSLDTPIQEVARRVFELFDLPYLLITRSAKGMVLFDTQGKYDFPVVQSEVKDVTGAGDTALAALAFAYGNRMDIKHAIQLANIASGIAIRKVGCGRVDLSEVAHDLLATDVEGKIFDDKHLFVLQQALVGKKTVILYIKELGSLDEELFSAIRKIKRSHKGASLLVCLGKGKHKRHSLTLLSSMTEVEFIILKVRNLMEFCATILPNCVYSIDTKIFDGVRWDLAGEPV